MSVRLDSDQDEPGGNSRIERHIVETEEAIENTTRFLEQMVEGSNPMRVYFEEVRNGLRSRLAELRRRRDNHQNRPGPEN